MVVLLVIFPGRLSYILLSCFSFLALLQNVALQLINQEVIVREELQRSF